MPKVRVVLSMHPDRPVEVDRDELPSLRSQGLLLEVEGETVATQAAEAEAAADAAADGAKGTRGKPAAGKPASGDGTAA
jgi:hypothetical protein